MPTVSQIAKACGVSRGKAHAEIAKWDKEYRDAHISKNNARGAFELDIEAASKLSHILTQGLATATPPEQAKGGTSLSDVYEIELEGLRQVIEAKEAMMANLKDANEMLLSQLDAKDRLIESLMKQQEQSNLALIEATKRHWWQKLLSKD